MNIAGNTINARAVVAIDYDPKGYKVTLENNNLIFIPSDRATIGEILTLASEVIKIAKTPRYNQLDR